MITYAELSQHIAHTFYSYELRTGGLSTVGIECLTCQEPLLTITEEVSE